jgi:hypothetical protein
MCAESLCLIGIEHRRNLLDHAVEHCQQLRMRIVPDGIELVLPCCQNGRNARALLRPKRDNTLDSTQWIIAHVLQSDNSEVGPAVHHAIDRDAGGGTEHEERGGREGGS